MSAAQIGNLQVALGINTAQFAAGLAQAQGSLGSFSGSLKTFAKAAAGALSLGAIGMAIKSNIDHMDELGKAAQKIGIPVEELSKLEYAARLSDVSLEDLTGTLAKFSKNVSEIAGGGQNDAGQAFKALGVSALDAQGNLRSTSDIMLDLADKFSVMKDGAGKTALAMALFGKSGAALIPLLNGGREAIRAAGVELGKFGGVVTAEAAAKAEEYNDNITRLQTAFQGLLQEALIPILPKLTELTQALIDLIKQGSDFRQFVSDAAGWLEVWGPSLTNTKREIEGIADALRYLGLMDPKPLEINIPGADKAPPPPKQTKTAPIIPDLTATKKAADEAAKALQKLKDEGQSIWDSTRTPLENYQLGIRNLNDLLQQGVIDHDTYDRAVKNLQDDFTGSAESVNELGVALTNMQDSLAYGIADTLTQLASGALSVKDAFRQMAQGISQELSQLAAQLIKSSILKLLSMLAGSMGGFTLGGASFGGFYANGGTLGSGKWGVAGEAGPEVIKGPASITPMDKLSGGQPVNVTVINNSGASVNTRQNSKGDLEVLVEDLISDKLIRGGNKIDAALARGYGLRRAGRS